MASGKIIIAIDGYSSTGKSSFAKLVAKGLGYIYADSGALYRAITYFAYTNGFIDEKGNVDKENLQKVIMNITVSFRTNKKGESRTLLNGADVEKQIRTLTVSNSVSRIAEIPYVRSFVNMQLRSMAVDKGLVMDGRDIGTAVFPNAELKIFMTASEQVRAMRRFKELQEKGDKETTFEQVLENLRKRDYIDSHRETDPLTRAKDAIELDNSSMTMEEEIEWLNKILLPNFNLKVELDKEE
ncbi:MAG: (d)CMP kinase [Bacteroidales bacterium]|nr:(d)CMP kinase [Bacteroidales bacterium]